MFPPGPYGRLRGDFFAGEYSRKRTFRRGCVNTLKEEVEALNKKLAELTEDDLKQFAGGIAHGPPYWERSSVKIKTAERNTSRKKGKARLRCKYFKGVGH